MVPLANCMSNVMTFFETYQGFLYVCVPCAYSNSIVTVGFHEL